MIEVVFVIVLTRSNKPELAQRIRGVKKADFAGGVAIGNEQKVFATARTLDVDAKSFVRFFIEQRIGGGVAQRVAIEAVGALGDLVFHDIEEMAAVGRPDGGGNAFGPKGKKFAVPEVLDLEGVLAEAGGVGGIGKRW